LAATAGVLAHLATFWRKIDVRSIVVNFSRQSKPAGVSGGVH